MCRDQRKTGNWRVSPRARPWKMDKTQKCIRVSHLLPATLAQFQILNFNDFRTVSISEVFSAAGHPLSDPVRCTLLFLPFSCDIICSKAHEGVSHESQPPTPNFKLIPQDSSPNVLIVTIGCQAPLVMEGSVIWVTPHPIIPHPPGSLGSGAPSGSDTAICRGRTQHTQPPAPYFPGRNQMIFTVGERGPIAGVTFCCFSPISNTGTQKDEPERAKLTSLGEIQYVFLLNSTISANFLKLFLQFWTYI